MALEVYCHTAPTGKRYIGYSAKGACKRWSQHVRMAASGSRYAFHCAIRKYGAIAFRSEVLAQVATEAEAKALEIECIAAAGSLAPGGYNSTSGGDGGRDRPVSAETRARMAEASRGHVRHAMPHTAESRAKVSASKKAAHTPELSAKLSAAQLKRFEDPAQRERAGAHNRGRKHTAETKARMSASHKRRLAVIANGQ